MSSQDDQIKDILKSLIMGNSQGVKSGSLVNTLSDGLGKLNEQQLYELLQSFFKA
jgi:hypothetical protein